MKYAEVEKLVFASITEGYCTSPQIRKFIQTKVEDGIAYAELQDVLDGMILDRKIILQDKGAISAYFKSDKVPSKFWLDGTGKLALEFTTMATNGHLTGRPSIKFDYQKVEEFAALVSNDVELAKKLGVSRGVVDRRKKEDAEFQAAYERGKAKGYVCIDCGKPRSKGSATRCRECYQKAKNSTAASIIQSTKLATQEIIQETEKPVADFVSLDEEEKQAPPQENKEEITKNLSETETTNNQTQSETLVIAKGEELVINEEKPQTRTVTVEIPLKDYEQLLIVARIEGYDSPQDAVLKAIESYIEIDMEMRRGDYWDLTKHVLQSVLKPHNYGQLFINRDFLLAKLLEAIFEDADSSEGGETEARFIYTWDLRTFIAELIAQEFVKQLIGEKGK